MEAALSQNLTWPNIRKEVRDKYVELPEKLAERPIAWNRVDVELKGPFTVKTPSAKK
jgi:hypothetical protein